MQSLFRDQASTDLKPNTVYFECIGLVIIDSYMSIIGRFFIVGQSSFSSTLLTIILTGIQEYFTRTNILELGKLKRRILRQKQLTPIKFARFKIIVAIDSIGEMSTEMWSIIAAGACELMMSQYPMSFDVGFNPENIPTTSSVLGLIFLQLAIESFVDILAMIAEMKKGIPIIQASTERPSAINVLFVLVCLSAIFIMLVCYKLTPYAFFCDSMDDICSCMFAHSNSLEFLTCLCDCQ